MATACTASTEKSKSGATAHQRLRRSVHERELETGSSVDHLLQFLHRIGFHSLGCWFGLEDAWLLGEGVDTLASRGGSLLLELQVQATSNFELAILLDLTGSKLHVCGDDCLCVLVLEAALLSNCRNGCRCSHGTACLHCLHCLHRWSHAH